MISTSVPINGGQLQVCQALNQERQRISNGFMRLTQQKRGVSELLETQSASITGRHFIVKRTSPDSTQ